MRLHHIFHIPSVEINLDCTLFSEKASAATFGKRSKISNSLFESIALNRLITTAMVGAQAKANATCL